MTEVQFAATRRVWAVLTRCPGLTVRVLSQQLGLPHQTIQNALHYLRGAGYIEYADNTARARRVVLPYAVLVAPFTAGESQ